MFSKQSDQWATPDVLFQQYDELFRFTLDAAADETNHKVDDWLGPNGIAEDALAVDWSGWRVWLNPPYSRAAEFVAYACKQSVENEVGSVLLLPSRTDTRWFHHNIWYAPLQKAYPHVQAIHFLKGRVKFAYDGVVTNSAPFPSLVVVLRGDW